MKFILQTTRKISFSAFILGVCLFSAQTAFSQRTWDAGGGADKAWSTAANWSGNAVPTATDDVTIIEGADVRVTAAGAVCRKLIVNGSTSGGQGTVTIDAMATLTVTADVNVLTGATNAALILFGGIIENNGTLTVTGRQNLDAMRFDNNTGGSVNSTYRGSGVLSCSTATAAATGATAANGIPVVFTQTNGTATFTTAATTGMYTFAVVANTSKTFFYCPRGTAIINGTGTIGATPVLPTAANGADTRVIRVVPSAASETPNLTIESGVTINANAVPSSTFSGIISVENSFGSATSNLTNRGTLNFGSTRGNPIALNNGTSATNTTNFTNEGTININGGYSSAVTSTTFGGIYFGGAGAQGSMFTNTSTGIINFNTTTAGTSIKPLFFSAAAPKYTITNNGTITIGTNGAPPTAFLLGDSKAIVNNAGTITVGAGNITGTTPGNAAFNNNTGGTLNFNSTSTSNFLTLTNAGGAITVADGVTLTIAGTSSLALTTGHVTLGTGNLIAGIITGGSLASHIITNGTGTLTQSVTSVGKLFPIGQSAMSYDPVVIKPAATLSFGARVGEQTTVLGTNPMNPALVVNREWDITGTAGTTDLAFTSSALNKDGSATRPAAAVGMLGHYNGTIWENFPATYSANTWAIAAYTGSFSPFIAASPGAVLSTELLNIKVKTVNNNNVISWETASETNNKGFDVERKTASGAWENLGFVQGTGKAATYTFEDKGPLSISYYRLRQMDFDGKETLSKVVSVSQNTKGRISISPNPTSDKVNILLNQNDASNATATVILSDMTGRQVWAQVATSNVLQLDLSNLAKGMYVVTVQSNNAVYQEKIIRQ